MNDEITDVTYDGQPIQHQSVHVEPFPVGPKYDDDYDRFYEEYKDKYDLRDVDFDVLLIKEKYSYTKKEDPKPIEGKEEKNITRTINVHLPNGEVQTTKQPVTIKRTYTSVAGIDKKTYSEWTKGLWEYFSAPKVDGYTALPTSVDEVKVNSDTLDAVVDIYYRADVPVLPATPVTPTDPSTPTTPVDPTDPSTPTINVKNNISNELSSSLKVKDEVDATTDSQEKLPQTGNKSSVIYSIFGLILTSLLGVWANVRKH